MLMRTIQPTRTCKQPKPVWRRHSADVLGAGPAQIKAGYHSERRCHSSWQQQTPGHAQPKAQPCSTHARIWPRNGGARSGGAAEVWSKQPEVNTPKRANLSRWQAPAKVWQPTAAATPHTPTSPPNEGWKKHSDTEPRAALVSHAKAPTATGRSQVPTRWQA